MKMKRFVSVVLCALMLLPILAGCGAKTEAPVATAAPAPAAKGGNHSYADRISLRISVPESVAYIPV